MIYSQNRTQRHLANYFPLLWLLGVRGCATTVGCDRAFGLTLGDKGDVSSRELAQFAVVEAGRPMVVVVVVVYATDSGALWGTEDGRDRAEPVELKGQCQDRRLSLAGRISRDWQRW